MLPMIGPCVSLSLQILQLLVTARGNKQEHKSLQSAVTNIHRFLQAVPPEGVSAEGNETLSKQSWLRTAAAAGCTVHRCVLQLCGTLQLDWFTSMVQPQHKQQQQQQPPTDLRSVKCKSPVHSLYGRPPPPTHTHILWYTPWHSVAYMHWNITFGDDSHRAGQML